MTDPTPDLRPGDLVQVTQGALAGQVYYFVARAGFTYRLNMAWPPPPHGCTCAPCMAAQGYRWSAQLRKLTPDEEASWRLGATACP